MKEGEPPQETGKNTVPPRECTSTVQYGWAGADGVKRRAEQQQMGQDRQPGTRKPEGRQSRGVCVWGGRVVGLVQQWRKYPCSAGMGTCL